ncbi:MULTISPECIES: glycosyltransferase [unclassified Tolypothrix]|uniref:glycosyltransferase n=1 Tax=unclassified Tolypothrix TaxID=2649714 RepID=UPI0005EAACC9|nr:MULTISPECIES: glycosyltransferase [unclassified Tolypothrix]BAY90520.1 family 2 glycosyl transferase [Microchaete diplosiphon NIES-3275]EKF01191.1 hopene-associated glycosyltransferase HpnB [Tolypothrix sp. PCC 7601]MBE9086884.1 glycosyltransferase [Tolypothrix sp. LEGE 11397]UYD24680.1 glycosyltransferase [Tolypothrix sp. PCC 7712]UYD33092.1 glycosyltransferase [Tolypothrix sp. PCC 7601]
MAAFVLLLTALSLLIWIGLLSFRGQFWRCDQQLEAKEIPLPSLPRICAIIPARNEADLLPITLRSLLLQDYPGDFNVFLVDDRSTDGTADFAQGVAYALNKADQFHIISGKSLPPGWSGKLWAVEQGIQIATEFAPDYFLLTDADIEHDSGSLRRLVAKAEQEDLDLVSVMVRLRCESFWEQILIPAFVFFFQKLYPFRWVNNPKNSTAAAAGGSILISKTALEKIGGIATIRQALIDDCALAKAVKGNQQWRQGRIWLGLSALTESLRPYPDLDTVWQMVARTAYTQLNYSPLLLAGTVLAMTLIYLIPPLATILGAVTLNWAIALLGLAAWFLMSFAYYPTIRFYKCPAWLACCLPAIAFLYTLMTIDSAIRHWQGRGGAWKGRVYPS